MAAARSSCAMAASARCAMGCGGTRSTTTPLLADLNSLAAAGRDASGNVHRRWRLSKAAPGMRRHAATRASSYTPGGGTTATRPPVFSSASSTRASGRGARGARARLDAIVVGDVDPDRGGGARGASAAGVGAGPRRAARVPRAGDGDHEGRGRRGGGPARGDRRARGSRCSNRGEEGAAGVPRAAAEGGHRARWWGEDAPGEADAPGRVMRTRGRGIERRPKRRVVEVVLHVEGHLARGRICRGVPRFSRGRAPRNSPLRRARHPPHKLNPTPKHVDARFLRGRRVRRRAARRVPAPPRVARPSSNARSAFASRVVRRITKGIHSSRPS